MPSHSSLPSPLLSLILLATPMAHGEAPRLDSYGDPLPQGAIYRIGTTRLRHTPESLFFRHKPGYPECERILFSPDGKFLLSSSFHGHAVCVWDAATGRQVRQFVPWQSVFALSPDGAVLALGEPHAEDKYDSELYEIATGKMLRELKRPFFSTIRFLAYSPDGKSLTALCEVHGDRRGEGIIRWDAITGKKLGEWSQTEDTLLALSADCRIAASMQKEKEHLFRLWDVASGKLLQEWKAEGDARVWGQYVTFSPDGRTIASFGSDSVIRIRDAANGKLLRQWEGRPRENPVGSPIVRIGWLTYAPDSKTLAWVNRDNNQLQLWDWRTDQKPRPIAEAFGPLAFSRDGKILAAGGITGHIRLWDTATGRERSPFTDPGRIDHVAFSLDGRTLAVASEGGSSLLVDAANGGPRCQLTAYHPVAFSPDGGSLLARRPSGGRWGPLCLLDAAGTKERARFRDTTQYDYIGAWSANGKTLITSEFGKSMPVRVWDTAAGKLLREFRDKEDDLTAICSPDARIVAWLAEDTIIRLLATDTGKELPRLMGRGNQAQMRPKKKGAGFRIGVEGDVSLTPIFSPDGKSLLTGRDGKSFALWDLAAGKAIFRLNYVENCLKSAAFSPDGRLLVLTDHSGDPFLVDAATGRVRHRLIQSKKDWKWIYWSVNRAFSPDSRLLAAAYDDRTLVLWETATGRPIRTWPGHGKGALQQMVFSPANRWLATVGADGTALVWDVVGLSRDGQLPMHKLTAEEAEQAWSDLASGDAAKGHRAIWTLAADPERALPLLRQRVHAVPSPEAGRIARLVADLESDRFAVRDKATRELRQLGELAEPQLRQALNGRPALELRRRAQGLLDELAGAIPSGDGLRVRRAVAVLEYMSDPRSLELLRTLAAGAPAAALSREAKAALGRRTSAAEPRP